MDKYIKLEHEVWKKLKLVATIDDTNIKSLATKYITAGLKKRLYNNPKLIKEFGEIAKK